MPKLQHKHMPKKLLSLSKDGALVRRSVTGHVEEVRASSMVACVLVDTSGSMAGNKLWQAQNGTVHFAQDSVRKRYSVAVVTFADSTTIVCPASQDIDQLRASLKSISIDGGTDMTRAIETGTTLLLGLHPPGGVLVLVTDGQPNNAATALAAAERAKQQGITILTIGTDDADRDFLARIASPGASSHVPSQQLAAGIRAAAGLLPK